MGEPSEDGAQVADERGVEARNTDSELALVDRLRRGDRAAFQALVNQYHGRLVRLARGFVSSGAAAEEVAQDTWLGVLGGLDKFEGRSSLKTWIFRILTNRAKTRGVRDGRTIPFSALGSSDAENDPAVDPSRFDTQGMWSAPPRRWDDETPERLLAGAEGMARLQNAIEKLPAGQRSVVTLRDIEGLEAAEVCNILEISETNQRVLLHRGRSKLRQVLEDYVEGR